jgi:hypothetical protein
LPTWRSNRGEQLADERESAEVLRVLAGELSASDEAIEAAQCAIAAAILFVSVGATGAASYVTAAACASAAVWFVSAAVCASGGIYGVTEAATSAAIAGEPALLRAAGVRKVGEVLYKVDAARRKVDAVTER